MTTLRTEAWLLRGISSIPGELALERGIVTFVATGTGSAWVWQLRKLETLVESPGLAASIDADKATQVMGWNVAEIRASCPWYYFGGGIKLSRAAITLRFGFGRPANMDLRSRGGGAAGAAREATRQMREVNKMRSVGRLWWAALREAQARPGASNHSPVFRRSGESH